MKKILQTLILFLGLTCLSGCSNESEVILKDNSVTKNTEFGSLYVEISIPDFMALGFEFGDSVDVSFTNGVKFNNIPFYSGYYCRIKEVLLVGYPGYPYITLAANIDSTFCDSLNLKEDDKVTIKLHEKGTYLDYQETFSMKYSDERNEYTTDEVFANFRSLCGGNLKENIIYRGASPCDNQHNRAKYANDLLEENNINFIFDLADSEEKYQGYVAKDDYKSSYVSSLKEEDNIAFMAMTADYTSDDYKHKLGTGLIKGLENDGPFYVHCTEGKDRTGFVCTVIEALLGASYGEMVNDYMVTYSNYYGITKENNKKKYDAIVNTLFADFILIISQNNTISDYSLGAKNYLLDCGMSENQINQFIEKISK